MANKGILISVVDDDSSLRNAIKRLINSIGLNVEGFASAEEFLGSGCYEDSACLILDVRLPGMSGMELHSRLIAANYRLPIIFISGHGDGDLRSQALEAGAVEFLQKPFSEQAMFNALYLSLAMRNGDAFDTPDPVSSF